MSGVAGLAGLAGVAVVRGPGFVMSDLPRYALHSDRRETARRRAAANGTDAGQRNRRDRVGITETDERDWPVYPGTEHLTRHFGRSGGMRRA